MCAQPSFRCRRFAGARSPFVGPLRRGSWANAMTSAVSASPFWLFRGAGALAVLAATLAGCAQPPSQHAHGSEFFSVAKYGPASPRVVDDGATGAARRRPISRRPPLHDRRAHLLSEREPALRGRRHGFVVRRRLPRTAHRQRRSLRHALADARRIRPCRCRATRASPTSATAIRSSCASTIAAPTPAAA